MPELKTFISWSGYRSKELALLLRSWLPLVIQDLRPWMSDVDIEAGTQAFPTLGMQLDAHGTGIVCLTPENLNSRWILFECGALAKHIDVSRVVPVLLDLSYTDVPQPLGLFQAVHADEDGIRRLLASLNALRSTPFDAATLERVFIKWWPELEVDIAKIRAMATPSRPREVGDKIDEALTLLRSMKSAERKRRYSLPTLSAFEYPLTSYNDEILRRTLDYSQFVRDEMFATSSESHLLVAEFCIELEEELASRRAESEE